MYDYSSRQPLTSIAQESVTCSVYNAPENFAIAILATVATYQARSAAAGKMPMSPKIGQTFLIIGLLIWTNTGSPNVLGKP